MSSKSRKKAGNRPTPEEMEKMMEAYERYSDPNVPPDQRPTQQQLSEEIGVPQTTLSYWFRDFEQRGMMGPEAPQTLSPTRPGKEKDRALAVTERTTTKQAIKTLSERSKTLYEKAINIGALVVDKYGDLVEIGLESGMKLEDFVAEVFNWFERKTEVEQQLHQQETEIIELRELTASNYIFKRKSQCILDFSKECLGVVKSGARINPRQAARALQNDLDKISQEIESKQKRR